VYFYGSIKREYTHTMAYQYKILLLELDNVTSIFKFILVKIISEVNKDYDEAYRCFFWKHLYVGTVVVIPVRHINATVKILCS
jgi:hypothetical protein